MIEMLNRLIEDGYERLLRQIKYEFKMWRPRLSGFYLPKVYGANKDRSKMQKMCEIKNEPRI